jgi:acyl-CoA reductase-like NAD-dependent aldehyde dehydrogenase
LLVALEDVDTMLTQGAEAASAAVEQLNEAAQTMSTYATAAHADRQELLSTVQADLAGREDAFTNLAATDVADNRADAIRQVYTYLDTVKSALGDRKVDQNEMMQIAQLGAYAQAGILANGGPQLSGIDGLIEGMTRQLARGEWPQARGGLGNFEASLPARPGR